MSENQNTGLLRKRRSASRSSRNKVAPAANGLVKALMSNTSPLNLDLTVSVAGYTHRAGFKLKIENIENLSGDIMDDWRIKCRAFGFEPTIAYDVTTSTATLHATRSAGRAPTSKCGNPFEKLNTPHTLTIVAGLLVVLNTIRHILSY